MVAFACALILVKSVHTAWRDRQSRPRKRPSPLPASTTRRATTAAKTRQFPFDCRENAPALLQSIGPGDRLHPTSREFPEGRHPYQRPLGQNFRGFSLPRRVPRPDLPGLLLDRVLIPHPASKARSTCRVVATHIARRGPALGLALKLASTIASAATCPSTRARWLGASKPNGTLGRRGIVSQSKSAGLNAGSASCPRHLYAWR
jgi:hypothetical protein